MFLKKNIQASSIAEVVIALAVISLCFMVASLVFVRVQTAPMRFQEVRMQTELQSKIFKALHSENLTIPESDAEEVFLEQDDHAFSDSLIVLRFVTHDQRLIWEQEWWKENQAELSSK